jgi:hypothetical protein
MWRLTIFLFCFGSSIFFVWMVISLLLQGHKWTAACLIHPVVPMTTSISRLESPPCPRAYFFTFFLNFFFLPKRERYPIPIVVVYVLLTSLFIESGAFFGFIFWLVAPSRKRKRKKKENPVTKVEQKCAFEFKQLIVLSAVCYRFIIMIIQL